MEVEGRRGRKKGRRKRRSGHCSWPVDVNPKKGDAHVSSQRRLNQMIQPTGAPNSARKRRREEKQTDEIKKTGGRRRREGKEEERKEEDLHTAPSE